MINAAEARKQTEEQILRIAKETIVNKLGPEIEKQTSRGKYTASIDIGDTTNPLEIGKAMKKILTEQYGYTTKFTYCEEYRAEYTVTVSWPLPHALK